MDITHITSLLGGIALFLYGMSIMGAGLEKLAGGKMQGILQKLTSSTIKGVIFGTLITGVIQSSAGTVVICVGLVNSGIMTLTQSVGVIMGANIGTTVTGQLIRMADISGDSLILTLIQPGGGVYRLHFLCVHPQREEKEHRPDHAGLRHPVHRHEPDGHRRVAPA